MEDVGGGPGDLMKGVFWIWCFRPLTCSKRSFSFEINFFFCLREIFSFPYMVALPDAFFPCLIEVLLWSRLCIRSRVDLMHFVDGRWGLLVALPTWHGKVIALQGLPTMEEFDCMKQRERYHVKFCFIVYPRRVITSHLLSCWALSAIWSQHGRYIIMSHHGNFIVFSSLFSLFFFEISFWSPFIQFCHHRTQRNRNRNVFEEET